MGSAWIGTEQVSNQLQDIVDSNRLDERDRTAADILGLSEVGSFSIIRRDYKRITRKGDVDRKDSGELGVGGNARWTKQPKDL